MSKATPGPWEMVSEVSFDRMLEANARLIAAAPEMLAALRLALQWVSAPADDEDISASSVAHRAIAAAIAKAEGRS